MRNNAAYLPESPIVYIILPKSIRNRASFIIFDFVLDIPARQCPNKFDIALAYSYLCKNKTPAKTGSIPQSFAHTARHDLRSNNSTMQRIIAPSMLSADFGHLDRDTRMIDKSAAQWIHIDVMDGVFVPNISFGFPVLKFIRQATTKPLDVHLMIVEPERYVKRFAEAGSDIVTFHYEATNAAHRCIDEIHAAGARAGISIKPATSVEVLRDLLPSLDLVLVMSVEPGFGGQKFMDGALGKIAQLRRTIDEAGLSTLIEVDGGISAYNARLLFDTGADVLVAGNAVFGADDPKAEIERMLDV